MGGPTITKLQWLLSTGFFGPSDHADMILSINSISSPFRGTQLVYALGERTDAAPSVRPISIGAALNKGVHIISYISPWLPKSLDLHAESRRLSYRDIGPGSLAKQLWKSDWGESRDATPFDVTFEACDERESEGEGTINPGTFYRSHVACMVSLEK